jgi:hypothetical protein
LFIISNNWNIFECHSILIASSRGGAYWLVQLSPHVLNCSPTSAKPLHTTQAYSNRSTWIRTQTSPMRLLVLIQPAIELVAWRSNTFPPLTYTTPHCTSPIHAIHLPTLKNYHGITKPTHSPLITIIYNSSPPPLLGHTTQTFYKLHPLKIPPLKHSNLP